MTRAVILLQDLSKETISKHALNLRKLKKKTLAIQEYIFITGQGSLIKRNILEKKIFLNKENVFENVFGKTDGDVTELCRVQNCVLGIIPVSLLSYLSRTVCACAVKLADGNISKECIKWYCN